MTDIPLEDPVLRQQWHEAEAAGDWAALSRLQVAEREDGGIPEGFALVERPDFIDRR